jgi:MFS family permease
MFTQMLQNVDSTALGYAAVWGMNKDLHLSTNQYTWTASMLFFGYLLFEWTMGLAAQHWHTGRVVGGVVTVWGLTMMSAALCTNFAGLATQRFFLGALQSVITPAWVLMSSIFYRKSEQTFRIIFWWSMNGVSLSFGGLVAFACGHINVSSLSPWKWSEYPDRSLGTPSHASSPH